jgi:cytoskeletal protein CcmA (bactofilin family)
MLGGSVLVKGEITGSEDLTINGRVEGRIDLPDHALIVGPNATIEASINARTVTVFGTIVGGITAREKLDVRMSGSVEGTLTCGRLVVQDGAHVTGRVHTQRAGRPAVDVRPALAPVA